MFWGVGGLYLFVRLEFFTRVRFFLINGFGDVFFVLLGFGSRGLWCGCGFFYGVGGYRVLWGKYIVLILRSWVFW